MPDPIRVLQVVDSLEPGGMENVLVQMVSRMDPAKYQFEICCLSRSGPFEKRLPPGTKVHVLDKALGFSWQTVGQLRRLLRGGRFDIAHSRHLGGLMYLALATPWGGHPALVHSEHTIWDRDDLSAKRLWQRRIFYRRAAAVFAVSQQQVTQMTELGVKHRNLRCILNGVDCDKFHPAEDRAEQRERLGLEKGGRWIGMVARFGAQKRHLDLLEAFDQVSPHHPQLRLLLVGDGGPEKDRVLKRLEASPHRERVHWAGFQQNPAEWYRAMDVLVVSSANEGLPNAVLEAMASGLPLVANDVCGVREIALHREHGWIEDYGTVDTLARGLATVAAADEESLRQAGERARRHVQQNFSLDAMVKAYDELFSSALSGRA